MSLIEDMNVVGDEPGIEQAMESLRPHHHLCLIYESRQQQFAAAVPFLRVGLQRRERVVYVVDENTADEVLAQMEATGLSPQPYLDTGQLVICPHRDTYTRGGRFDPDEMIRFLSEATEKALADGLSALRVTGEMTWALNELPGVERVIEYEARLNRFFPEFPCTAICQYNRHRFPARILRDVIYTHPYVIWGDRVFRNPHYIPPDEFLSNEDAADAEVDRLLAALDQLDRAERQLRQSEHRYRRLFERTPNPVFILDHAGRFLEANQAALAFLERTHQTLDLIRLQDILAGNVEAKDLLSADSPSEDRVETSEVLCYIHGREKSLELALTPARWKDRDVLFASGRDVTARRQMMSDLADRTAELERSNAELERFAYVASHDLQEPLRMVSGYVRLLARRYEGKLDRDADEFIGFASEGADRMQQMIEDLLSYSRVRRKRQPTDRVDLNQVLHKARENLSSSIDEAGATIDASPLPSLAGDATQLLQLFQNLLSNAIKFRRPDVPAKVSVSADRDARRWQVRIEDNGIGIEEKYLERIFEVFQRLHTRQEYPGTGIGLALCRRIAETHGGRLWAESQPGRGTTFHLTLPAEGENP